MAALTVVRARPAVLMERHWAAGQQAAPAAARCPPPRLAAAARCPPPRLARRRTVVRPSAAATALAPATISSAKLDRRLEAAQQAVLDAIGGVEGRGKGGMPPEQQVRCWAWLAAGGWVGWHAAAGAPETAQSARSAWIMNVACPPPTTAGSV